MKAGTKSVLGMAVLCGAAVLPLPVAAAEVYLVAPELWDRPRSAQAVSDQPGVRQAVALYLSRPASRLVIHHGPGTDALLQAEELRAWLMALAIEGARIRLSNDAAPKEPLRIEVAE